MLDLILSFFGGITFLLMALRSMAKINPNMVIEILGIEPIDYLTPITPPPKKKEKKEDNIFIKSKTEKEKAQNDEILIPEKNPSNELENNLRKRNVTQNSIQLEKSQVLMEDPSQKETLDEVQTKLKSSSEVEMQKREKPQHQITTVPAKEVIHSVLPQITVTRIVGVGRDHTPTVGSKYALDQLDKPHILQRLKHFHSNTIKDTSFDYSFFNSHEDPKSHASMHGWAEIRSKIGNNLISKTVWHWRYVMLHDLWLSYYENEKCRPDDCYGWVFLSGCTVTLRDQVPQEVMVENPLRRIFHKHGPEPTLPPCKNKHLLFHKKSKRIIMRCGDATSKWMGKLQEACSLHTLRESPSDSDDNEDMYHQGGIYSTLSENIQSHPDEISTIQVLHPEEGKVIVKSLRNSILKEVSKESATNNEDILKNMENQTTPSYINTTTPAAGEGSPSSETSQETSYVDSVEEENLGEELKQNPENREGLLKLLTKAVGLDITAISLPVSLNEPTSFLQKMAETIFYSDTLLSKANNSSDSRERMTYVATFAISVYSNITRTTKPFNPLLGETFEYNNPNKFTFVAEQVSHHPPIGASYADHPDFMYYQEQGVKTKFGGNSLLCEGVGIQHIILKKWGEHYSWSAVKTIVHNVVVGSMWVDHFGDTEITNHNSGEKANVEFKKCGWFGKGQYEVRGWILDSQGHTQVSLNGKWDKQIEATVVGGNQINFQNPIWTHINKIDPNNPWKLSPFAQELNKIDDTLRSSLPSTDSRLRPDRLALEMGDTTKAGSEKRHLENEQRQQAKARQIKRVSWKPKYFDKELDPDTKEYYWKYMGNYFRNQK